MNVSFHEHVRHCIVYTSLLNKQTFSFFKKNGFLKMNLSIACARDFFLFQLREEMLFIAELQVDNTL
jgi:hypothetical protein